jgi:hypothetical protein
MLGGMEFRELLFEGKSASAGSAPPDTAFEDLGKHIAFRIVVLRPNGERFLLGLFATS